MTIRLLFSLLFVTVCFCESSINFLDCSKSKDSWSIWRRCCASLLLPNDCECFDISWFSDFRNSMYYLPKCPSQLGVKFYLYDEANKNSGLNLRADPIEDGPFNGTRRTVVISHGFNDKPKPNAKGFSWVLNMKDELLAYEDLNVIVVDWQQAAKGDYLQAVANTRSVGAMLARLIVDLNTVTRASFQSFHLVGHSLGSHVSGIVGKEIERLTGQNLGRITGLDPAGLRFESFSANVRLDKSDANFVDIIHTDAEGILSSGYGIRTSIGHVDYWPNGGRHQPGCPPESYGILGALDPDVDIYDLACSHFRCHYLFTNSIKKCNYDPQGPCSMGYHASPECRGNIYPITTSEQPFC